MVFNAIIPLFFGNLRGSELIIILIIILLLFGGRKIPELMKGVGKGIRSFKEGLDEAKKEINKDVEVKEDKTKEDTKENKE